MILRPPTPRDIFDLIVQHIEPSGKVNEELFIRKTKREVWNWIDNNIPMEPGTQYGMEVVRSRRRRHL